MSSPNLRRARWLLTLPAAFVAVVPNVADWSPTHIFHPEWTPHARFHTVWLLATCSGLALFALWRLWRAPEAELRATLHLSASLVGLILGGFFFAALTRGLYSGAFTDVGGISSGPAGIDANLLAFSVCSVFVGAALFVARER